MRRIALISLVSTVAAACRVEEIPPSPTVDSDRDGFSEVEDCDDLSPTIHPQAPEICDGVDNDCDGATDEYGAADAPGWFRDADGDGYGDPTDVLYACEQPVGYLPASAGFDCDDRDYLNNPDGEEICDLEDNDCDGNVDEGTASDAPTWYLDSDGDGYGTDWDTKTACQQPSGYVAAAGDCDDTDAAANPGEVEVCDGEGGDENCDGYDDDDDGSVTLTTPFYPDADGDGWGDPAGETQACEAPSGYVAVAEDCDDEDPAINPDNAEVCGDGVDNDCDADVDEEDAPYPVRWYADADSDGYGDPENPVAAACAQPSGAVDNALDCDDGNARINPDEAEGWYDGIDTDCDGESDDDADGDGYDIDLYGGTDCDDTEPTAFPGMPELCGDGVDNDCDEVVDPCAPGATITGADTNDRFGAAIAGEVDWDGDGQADLVVAADRQAAGGSGRGAVYVVLGPVNADAGIDTAADAILAGVADHDRAGWSLASLGDADGDGYGDLVVGAFGEDSGGAEAGAAYVVYGPYNGTTALDDAGATLVGEVGGDDAGWAVSATGDVNGDGQADVLLGASGQDSGGIDAGAAYLLAGPVTASADLSFADTRFVGVSAGEQAGAAVTGGDLDGDGIGDVVVGAPYLVDAGAYVGGAYVVLGPVTTNQVELVDADLTWVGSTAGDLAGYALALVGDTDGDGRAEFAVGAPEDDTSETTAGAVYLVGGQGLGEVSLAAAGGVVLGENVDDYFGCAVAGAGDLDGDGVDDLVAGARLDDWAASDAGAGYAFLGPIDGTVSAAEGMKLVGGRTGDWLGDAVAGTGDLDGDGARDLAIGAPLADDGDTDAGAVYLLGSWGF